MFRSLHKVVGRYALAVVLVLATHLVSAGQMSLAVMPGDMALTAAHNIARVVGITDVDHAAQPCCDGGTMNTLTCVVNASAMDAAVPASPIADLLPLAPGHFFVALVGASPPRRRLPAASAGSFPPPYILFRRFLS